MATMFFRRTSPVKVAPGSWKGVIARVHNRSLEEEVDFTVDLWLDDEQALSGDVQVDVEDFGKGRRVRVSWRSSSSNGTREDAVRQAKKLAIATELAEIFEEADDTTWATLFHGWKEAAPESL